MTWGAVAGAAIGVVGSAMSKDGQGGTTTASKEPWGPAAPWLTQNVGTGQALQGYYQANPFNQQQQNAFGRLSQGTDYANQLIPQLIAQLSGQGGFDRTKPLGRPSPMMFPAMPSFGGQNPVNMNVANNPFAQGLLPPAPAPAPAPASGYLAPGTLGPWHAGGNSFYGGDGF